MHNAFTVQFGDHIHFIYNCFDRVIVRGYIHSLFTTGGLVWFLRNAGFNKVTDGVMRIFTDQLNLHIKKVAEKHKIDLLWWPSVDGGKDGAKQAYVENHYVQKCDKKKGNFIYCIISDVERTLSFSTRKFQKKDGGSYDKVYKCNKMVKHYYIYFHDQLLGGPCFLKLCTYFPFNAEFYFNGHNAIRLQLDKQGIGYRMHNNSFTWVDDPEAIQKIASSLTGEMVQSRINYWMGQFFRFDKGKYSKPLRQIGHQWYSSQTEVCTNIIFQSSRFGTSLFERLLDKYSRIGQPDSLIQIFDRRRSRHGSKSVQRLYDHQASVKHWHRNNSIKMYNKCGYLLRIESTINSPKLLGLKKHLLNLQEYLGRGIGNNDRLMSRYADVDRGSLSDGELSLFNQPVRTASGIQIAAPDLRRERQRSLFRELLNAKYSAFGFRTSDLLRSLSNSFENRAEIRYELKKLRVRGLVERVKGKQYYRVTEVGLKILWLQTASNSYLVDPVFTKTYRKDAKQIVSQPSKLEEAYDLLDRGLSLVAEQLFIKRAA